MLKRQTELKLSAYSELYEQIIPKDNFLRKMLELVDFEFIYDELKDKYSESMGRNAVNPIMMFKYLLLKQIYPCSDVDLVNRAMVDMSFKYFLGLTPEASVIESSSLTKFRRERLKDSELLDKLIAITVMIAKENGLLRNKTIIVDSTHTGARFNQKSPRQVLQEKTKNLRKEIYKLDERFKDKMPKKPNNGILEDEIDYTKTLCTLIKKEERFIAYPHIQETLNYLDEIVDDHLHDLKLSKDEDARTGHKTADTSFFGYKTHIAMSEDRIITSAVVTSGEKHDGKQLKALLEKTRQAGMEVDEIIGDAAYSEAENIEMTTNEDIQLISKLSRTVSQGNKRKVEGFFFNKDAGMMVCPEGHMAFKKVSTRPEKHKVDGKGTVETYFFDIEKCKICPLKEQCYKENSKTKSYSISIKSNIHHNQMNFQNTEYFKSRVKERYKIEAKNSEMKHRHGYATAQSHDLFGMTLQAATAIFVVNMKRIMKEMV
ncbi:IS1182 family transposase [Liberiplasma polymorphum]|uniref:IS1182 family transposase n=1 Tax=Liberiplasma polymorphum TaxID=3374570 RepID=UPI0037731D6D